MVTFSRAASLAGRGHGPFTRRSRFALACQRRYDRSGTPISFTNLNVGMPALIRITSRLAALREGDPADLPRLLTETYLGAWEDAGVSTRLSVIVRASAESPAAAARSPTSAWRARGSRLRRTSSEAIRAQVALGQLFGLAVSRYLIGVQPLASLPFAELVDLAERSVRACLEAPVNALGSSDARAEP